jgi:3-hydroxyacyl-CoA dehydrogenase
LGRLTPQLGNLNVSTPPTILQEKVGNRVLGVKTGKGFYAYTTEEVAAMEAVKASKLPTHSCRCGEVVLKHASSRRTSKSC